VFVGELTMNDVVGDSAEDDQDCACGDADDCDDPGHPCHRPLLFVKPTFSCDGQELLLNAAQER
jgi:hypothetical protein